MWQNGCYALLALPFPELASLRYSGRGYWLVWLGFGPSAGRIICRSANLLGGNHSARNPRRPGQWKFRRIVDGKFRQPYPASGDSVVNSVAYNRPQLCFGGNADGP